MKIIAACTLALLSSTSFAKSKPCDENALKIVRNIIEVTTNRTISKKASYIQTGNLIFEGKQNVEIQVLQVRADDRNSMRTYELTFKLKNQEQKCDLLEAVKLVDEN